MLRLKIFWLVFYKRQRKNFSAQIFLYLQPRPKPSSYQKISLSCHQPPIPQPRQSGEQSPVLHVPSLRPVPSQNPPAVRDKSCLWHQQKSPVIFYRIPGLKTERSCP